MNQEKLENMKVAIMGEVALMATDFVIGKRSPAAKAAITEDLNNTIAESIAQYFKHIRIPLPRQLQKSIQRLVWDNVVEALAYGESRAIECFKTGFFDGFQLGIEASDGQKVVT